MRIDEKPVRTDSAACTWAMAVHLAALGMYLGLLFTNVLVPWLIWRWKREADPMIAGHALAALNFQISVMIVGLAAIVVAVLIPLAWILVIAVFTLNIICIGRAADRAREGLDPGYPRIRDWIRP